MCLVSQLSSGATQSEWPSDPAHSPAARPPQIQDKMRAKRAQQAAAEKQARRAAGADETDRMRQALRGGKKQQGGKQKNGGGGKGGGKGFGA